MPLIASYDIVSDKVTKTRHFMLGRRPGSWKVDLRLKLRTSGAIHEESKQLLLNGDINDVYDASMTEINSLFLEEGEGIDIEDDQEVEILSGGFQLYKLR